MHVTLIRRLERGFARQVERVAVLKMQRVAGDPLDLDDRARCRQVRDCKTIGSRRAGIGRFHGPNLQIGAGSGRVDIAWPIA